MQNTMTSIVVNSLMGKCDKQMSTNYLEILNNFIKNESAFWKYYPCYLSNQAISVFSDPVHFIDTIFMYAEKQALEPISRRELGAPNVQMISKARAAHSVSTFFLGAMLAQKLFDGAFSGLCTEPSPVYSDGSNVYSHYYKFSYIWTLTCLFHDYGYYYEHDQKKTTKLLTLSNRRSSYNVTSKSLGLQCWMQRFIHQEDMRHSIWAEKVILPPFSHKEDRDSRFPLNNELQKQYSKSIYALYLPNRTTPISFPSRTSKIISRYFSLNLCAPPEEEPPHIDHGIAGGLLFFDKILKNYVHHYKSACSRKDYVDFSNFTVQNSFDRSLNFSFDQLPLFAYISDSIMNHNVWRAHPNSKTAQIYKDFSLDSLIGKNYGKINFWQNPLLFILVVADSIEPYKLLNDNQIDSHPYCEEELLSIFRTIQFEVQNNCIVLRVPSEKCFKLESRLKSMRQWISLAYEKRSDGAFQINIPQQ